MTQRLSGLPVLILKKAVICAYSLTHYKNENKKGFIVRFSFWSNTKYDQGQYAESNISAVSKKEVFQIKNTFENHYF